MAEELIKVLAYIFGIMIGVCALTIPLGFLLAKYDEKITKLLDKIKKIFRRKK